MNKHLYEGIPENNKKVYVRSRVCKTSLHWPQDGETSCK